MTYKVKLNFFEGPLDLLLFLIKKERIDVYDIPIAKITEQYLAYLELMKLLDLNIAGEFLVMAATLMHIKSRTLLPPDETEEEKEQEDPREELVRRLLEYKKYKEAAERLKEMRELHKGMFLRRPSGEGDNKVLIEGEGYFEASLFDLISAFKNVLKTVPKEKFHQVIKDRFSVSDKIHYIYHVLAASKSVRFTELFSGTSGKDEMIATFLAVLELIKLREILIVQKEFFGEIEIVKNPEVMQDPRPEGTGAAEARTGGS